MSSQPFTLGLPLDTYPHLALGASAGTGKTYTLQALAIRNLIEGYATIGQILMVTFTKAAAAEMRQRLVRSLSEAIHTCQNWDQPSDHFIHQAYEDVDARQLDIWTNRLEQALADVDQAVVTTLDSFWAMLAKWLSIEPVGELERIDEAFIARSTVHHYAIKAAQALKGRIPLGNYQTALSVVQELLNAPDTKPDTGRSSLRNEPELLCGLALRSVQWAKQIRSQNQSFTYTDVLDTVAAYVNDDGIVHGLTKAERLERVHQLCAQFRVVMVDEVQDTNAQQLRLLQDLFTSPNLHLYLVGDPKQAIYEFRGGDINAWDDASAWIRSIADRDQDSHQTTTVFELETNFRSDRPVVDAANALFTTTSFSHSATYQPVTAAVPEARIRDANGTPIIPCNLRTVEFPNGKSPKAETVAGVIKDVVRYCQELLDSGYTYTPSAEQGDEGRPITPGDITVLLRRNDDIFRLHTALLSAGIPAYMASGNVLQSEAATHWLDLLNALMENPSPDSLTLLTVGPWLGGTTHDAQAMWTLTLGWREVLERYGPGALLERIDQDTGFAAILLGRPDGRRLLTDLEHVGELLDASGEWGRRRWFTWLQRASQTYNPRADEERRRSDVDSGAVELRTSHSAKGLERPIVLVPFAWMAGEYQASRIPILYYRASAPEGGSQQTEEGATELDGTAHSSASQPDPKRKQRCLFMGYPDYEKADSQEGKGAQGQQPDASTPNGGRGDGAPNPSDQLLPKDFNPKPYALEAAEHANRRLLYVEATRAKHHVAIWDQYLYKGLGTVGALVYEAAQAAERNGVLPDARLLEQAKRTGGSQFFKDASILQAFYPTLFKATQLIGEDLDEPTRVALLHAEPDSQAEPRPTLCPPRQDRVNIDHDWRRSSFSGWVQEQDDTDRPLFDEPESEMEDVLGLQDGVEGEAVHLTVMPSGAETGSAIHRLYEVLDFQDPNRVAAIEQFLDDIKAGPLAHIDPQDRPAIVRGLDQTLTTPLGGPLGLTCLQDLDRAHRADEMGYEFAVHARSETAISLRSLAKTWKAHLRDDDPFTDYVHRLAEHGDERRLRGYLLGYIDLVAQVDRADGVSTWTVMDYKTNRVALPGVEVLRQNHYTQDALRQEMEAHHYPLQSLLYQVALHRFLRASLKGYDPALHLGGSAYLFLRGMNGPVESESQRAALISGEPGAGVFWWTPGVELIEAVDAAFIGGAR